LEVKALWSFETSGVTEPKAQRHIPEDWSPNHYLLVPLLSIKTGEEPSRLGCDIVSLAEYFLMLQRSVMPLSSESSGVLDCLILKMKASHCIETSGIPLLMTQCHIPADWRLQQYHSENLRSCTVFCISEGHPKMCKPEEDFVVGHVLSC
jgi:hypothetical protein